MAMDGEPTPLSRPGTLMSEAQEVESFRLRQDTSTLSYGGKNPEADEILAFDRKLAEGQLPWFLTTVY